MGFETDVEHRIEALLEAARSVEHWYYERDAMWVELSPSSRQDADAAVVALHTVLVELGESGVVADE